MQGDGELRQPGKQRVAQYRQQDVLAEEHDEAADTKRDKGDGRRPVDKPLPVGKALHEPPAGRLMQLHCPFGFVEQQNGTRHDDQKNAAHQTDRTVAELPPGLAVGIDQDVGLAATYLCGDKGIRFAGANFPPHRRVV